MASIAYCGVLEEECLNDFNFFRTPLKALKAFKKKAGSLCFFVFEFVNRPLVHIDIRDNCH
jgi:hypothetical protein